MKQMVVVGLAVQLLVAPFVLAGEITLVPTISGSLDLELLPGDEIFGLDMDQRFGRPIVSVVRRGGGALGPSGDDILTMEPDFIFSEPEFETVLYDLADFIKGRANLQVSPDEQFATFTPQADNGGSVFQVEFYVDDDPFDPGDLFLVPDCVTTPAGNPALDESAAAVADNGRTTIVCPNSDGPFRTLDTVLTDATGPISDVFPVDLAMPALSPDIANVPKPGAENQQVVVAHKSSGTPGIVGWLLEWNEDMEPLFDPFVVQALPPLFDAAFAKVVADRISGNFLVGWRDFASSGGGGDPSDVVVRRFDCDGNPLSGEKRLDAPMAQNDLVFTDLPIEDLILTVTTVSPALVGFAEEIATTVYDGRTDSFSASGLIVADSVRIRDVAAGVLPAQRGSSNLRVVVAYTEVAEGASPSWNGPPTPALRFQVYELAGVEDPRVFEDRFESGDTSAWSQVVP